MHTIVFTSKMVENERLKSTKSIKIVTTEQKALTLFLASQLKFPVYFIIYRDIGESPNPHITSNKCVAAIRQHQVLINVMGFLCSPKKNSISRKGEVAMKLAVLSIRWQRKANKRLYRPGICRKANLLEDVGTISYFIIWLANFASFDWSIPGPITYGTDPDGPVTFAFFCFCFICTLFWIGDFYKRND